MVMNLDDDLAVCVGCGLCLPHCPTYRITGEEAHSPRGRIALIKVSMESDSNDSRDVRPFLDTCLQCRGCEPACPSGVAYGRIFTSANRDARLADRRSRIVLKAGLSVLRRPRLLGMIGRFGSFIGAAPGVRLVVPRKLRIEGVSIRQGRRYRAESSQPTVWIFTGCVMNVWFREVHRATAALAEACGEVVATPLRDGSCCGALHLHSGFEPAALKMAHEVMSSMPGTAPIVVDAAGCGAMLKEYGELIGTSEAEEFSARVMDVHEWLKKRTADLLHLRKSQTTPARKYVVQEPCHLRHVQRVSMADTLEMFVDVVRLADEGLCCGAGGAYSMREPEFASILRDRKIDAISRAVDGGEAVVVTSNPGCHLHLAGAGAEVASSAVIIAESLGLIPRRRS